ncbi:cysteine hydrolase [Bengtsoniella intestinalis]|uniref:cysteine hydrolase family protein n=1 Tax=Bengtsoniella intestinalis TaxID=3073143 RepID=UPI00391F0DAE
MNVLLVIDMQTDFVDGVLGSAEAQAIVPYVVDRVKNFDGTVIFTRDTHGEDYLDTAEGKKLPVPHCIAGTEGWEVIPALRGISDGKVIDKPTFGSMVLAEELKTIHGKTPIQSIILVGVCTDICVISNAMIVKVALPEVAMYVEAKGCAGVTPDSHENALKAVEMCQITVVR